MSVQNPKCNSEFIYEEIQPLTLDVGGRQCDSPECRGKKKHQIISGQAAEFFFTSSYLSVSQSSHIPSSSLVFRFWCVIPFTLF